jgi:hypothetical protein
MFADWLLGRPAGTVQNMFFGPADSTWGSVFMYNEAGVLVFRNRHQIKSEIAVGFTEHTLWQSDAAAAVAAQGAALTTTLTEMDATFQGSRITVAADELGPQFQIVFTGRVLTSVNNSTVSLSIRDTSNIANILAFNNTAHTFSSAAVGNFTLAPTWVTRPPWLTGTKTLAVYMQASSGTTVAIVVRKALIRWKGGGA